MEALLGGLETELDHRLDGVGRLLQGHPQLPALARREVGQHEVGRILPARRAPDAHAQPRVVPRAQGPADGAQAVVPALAPAALEAQRVRGQVDNFSCSNQRGIIIR